MKSKQLFTLPNSKVTKIKNSVSKPIIGTLNSKKLLGLLLILSFLLPVNIIESLAYTVAVDNNVDADSDVDTTANIGDDGATSYLDAQTLEGTDQVINEAQGSGYVAGNNIEDFVDTNVDTQSPTDLGSHTSFPELTDKDDAYDTMTEAQGSGYVAGNNEETFINAVTDTQTPTDLGTIGDWTELQDYDSVTTTLTEENVASAGGSEWISVLSEDSTWTEWDSNQGSSPYLDAPDETNYLWELSTAGQQRGWFEFSDTALSGTGITINVSIKCKNSDSAGNDGFDVYWDVTGGGGALLGWYQPGTAWEYITVEVAGTFSATEVNAFRIYLDTHMSGQGDDVYADHGRIGLTQTGSDNYRFDREFSLTSLTTTDTNEYLCIRTGTIGSETLDIDVWHSSAWTDIGTDIVDANDGVWINISISTWLDNAIEYFRFEDAVVTSDTGVNTWQIDCILIHTWTDATDDYELELEFAFASLDTDETNEYLCIKTGTIGDEELDILVWTGVWTDIGTNILTTNDDTWINISITTWLDNADEYFLFRDTSQANEGDQSTWLIDCVLIHTWTDQVDDYELAWEHQVQSLDEHKDYYVLTVFGQATGGDSEAFSIELWNSSDTTWYDTLQEISTVEEWHNWTITSGFSDCLGATITYRFIGNTETADSTQSTLNVDYSGIRGYNFTIHSLPETFNSLEFSPDDLYHPFDDSPLSFTCESGVTYNVQIKATDGTGTPIALGWVYFNSVDDTGSSTVLTTSDQNLYTSQTPGSTSHYIYLWINCGWTGGSPITNTAHDFIITITLSTS